jgi:hypothetical protein
MVLCRGASLLYPHSGNNKNIKVNKVIIYLMKSYFELHDENSKTFSRIIFKSLLDKTKADNPLCVSTLAMKITM